MTPRDPRNSLDADALEALVRRENWKSTRAPFQRIGGWVPFSVAKNDRFVIVLTTSGTDQIERFKRISMKIVVPSDAALSSGYFGLVRIPDGFLAENSAHAPQYSDPVMLRPQQFLCNPDHATYWDAYLPAVNIATSGVLQFNVVRHNDGTSGNLSGKLIWRAVVERGI